MILQLSTVQQSTIDDKSSSTPKSLEVEAIVLIRHYICDFLCTRKQHDPYKHQEVAFELPGLSRETKHMLIMAVKEKEKLTHMLRH